MTLHELWQISPESHVFVEEYKRPEVVTEYHGEAYGRTYEVENIKATRYGNYSSVLQVRLKNE